MRKGKSIRRLLAVLMAAVLMMSVCAPAALASYKAKINSNTKVYNVPSASGKSIPVPKGLTVSVTAVSGGWARVQYKGVTAYIPTSRLNKASRVSAYTAKSTPVYKQASSSSSKIGTLSIATKVYVVGKSGDYYRVQNSSGSVTGYIKSGYLTTKAKLTAAYNAYKQAQADKNKQPSGGGSSGNGGGSSGGEDTSSLVALMKSLVGRPYASSAKAPSSFNCSAFVSYVLGRFGVSTKSTAKAQSNDGSMEKVTSISKLKLGDILCFDNDGDGACDHTAVYAGGGVFYEASQTAKKVQKNSFSSYYTNHFMWARRP